jgi:hypothetical protein
VISLEKFKSSLGETAEKMTEEQILKLREDQDKLADIFFYMWLKELKQQKQMMV